MTTVRLFWKRCVGSVTVFARRYQSNVFLRTEVRIAVLQAIYAGVMLALSIGALILLYRDIIAGVAGGSVVPSPPPIR